MATSHGNVAVPSLPRMPDAQTSHESILGTVYTTAAKVPDAAAFKEPVRTLLAGRGIDVRAIEWISPTLEDVFISAIKARGVT